MVKTKKRELSDEEKKNRMSRFVIQEGDVVVSKAKPGPYSHWQLFRGRALFWLLDVKKPSDVLPVRGSPIALATAIRLVSPKAWAEFIKKFPEYPLSINKTNYPEGYPDPDPDEA